jgi:hypothetical protein
MLISFAEAQIFFALIFICTRNFSVRDIIYCGSPGQGHLFVVEKLFPFVGSIFCCLSLVVRLKTNPVNHNLGLLFGTCLQPCTHKDFTESWSLSANLLA